MGGDIIGRAANGKFQKRRSRGAHSWHDPAKQEKFLIQLAATANISRSAEAAGLRTTGGYIYRQRDPMFRAAWDQALAEGVTRMRALLIEAGEAQAAVPRGADGEIDRIALAAFNPGLAMALVKMHGPTVDGEALGRGRPVPRSADELRALILEKLEAARAGRTPQEGAGRTPQEGGGVDDGA